MKRLRTLFDAKLWKFLLVGVINTLVGTAIMFGLYNIAGCSYWVASAANYVLTSILSFFLNKYFTFRSREREHRRVLPDRLRRCKAAVSAPACQRLGEHARQRGHACRHGVLHRPQLPRPALFRLPQPENRRKLRHIPGCTHIREFFWKNTNMLLTNTGRSGYINI